MAGDIFLNINGFDIIYKNVEDEIQFAQELELLVVKRDINRFENQLRKRVKPM